MKQLILTLVAVICGLNTIKAQNKTYVGLEFSLSRDLNKIEDKGNYLMNLPLVEPQGGVTIRQDIKKHFFIESGVIVKPYSSAIGFRPIPVSFIGTEGISVLIPVRLGLNINLYQQKIYVVPVVGYSYSSNTPSRYGKDAGTQESTNTVISYTSVDNSKVSRNISLLQTGLGFDFQIFQTLRLTLSYSYYKGYRSIWVTDINYIVNNSSQYNGRVSTDGDFWCVSAGVKYPLNNLWSTKH